MRGRVEERQRGQPARDELVRVLAERDVLWPVAEEPREAGAHGCGLDRRSLPFVVDELCGIEPGALLRVEADVRPRLVRVAGQQQPLADSKSRVVPREGILVSPRSSSQSTVLPHPEARGPKPVLTSFPHQGGIMIAAILIRQAALRPSFSLLGRARLAGTAQVRIVQTNSAGDNIHLIDPGTNQIVGEVKGVPINHGAAAAPDGSRFYFSSEAEQTLHVVDGKTLQTTKKIPLTGRPNNISISKDGRARLRRHRVGAGRGGRHRHGDAREGEEHSDEGRHSQRLRHA